MGESPDKDAGDDKKIESASIENQLPVVWSPKLEAADEVAEGLLAPRTAAGRR